MWVDKMEKFQKGDIVWCKVHNRYGITGYHVKCEVVGLYGLDAMVVKVVDEPYKTREYAVNPKYFEKVKKSIKCV